jgi:hypothetical protein
MRSLCYATLCYAVRKTLLFERVRAEIRHAKYLLTLLIKRKDLENGYTTLAV